MSLTPQDLVAIGKIVDDKIDKSDLTTAKSFTITYNRLDRMETRFNKRLAAVEDKVEALNTTVNDVYTTVRRIDSVQQAELVRNDHQDLAIKQIRKTLHST